MSDFATQPCILSMSGTFQTLITQNILDPIMLKLSPSTNCAILFLLLTREAGVQKVLYRRRYSV